MRIANTNTKYPCKCLCNVSMCLPSFKWAPKRVFIFSCKYLKRLAQACACFIQFNALYQVNKSKSHYNFVSAKRSAWPSSAHLWPGAIKWHSLHCSLENICAYNYVCAVLQVTVHPFTCTPPLPQSICLLAAHATIRSCSLHSTSKLETCTQILFQRHFNCTIVRGKMSRHLRKDSE